MIGRILLYGFLAYLLYKVIFGLVIPVYKTTRKMKKGFKEMHSRMNEYMNHQQEGNNQEFKSKESSGNANKPGDYIDYEDVK